MWVLGLMLYCMVLGVLPKGGKQGTMLVSAIKRGVCCMHYSMDGRHTFDLCLSAGGVTGLHACMQQTGVYVRCSC